MNNLLIRFIAIVFSLMMFLVLFVFSVEIVVYNLPYYKWHYTQRSIDVDTGMSVADLMTVTENMVDYLKNDRDSLSMQAIIDGSNEEVFGEREKSHMVDVKNMAILMHKVGVLCGLIACLILLAILVFQKKYLITLFKSVKYVFAAMMVLIISIGTLLVIDFDKYFTLFHETFFDNDLWLLDPNTDILINMVPEIFFFTTAMLVILVFAALTAIFIVGTSIIKKKMLRKLG